MVPYAVSLDLLSSDIERLIQRLRTEIRVPEANLIAVRNAIEDAISAAPLPASDRPTKPEAPRSRSSQRLPAVRFPLDEDDGDED